MKKLWHTLFWHTFHCRDLKAMCHSHRIWRHCATQWQTVSQRDCVCVMANLASMSVTLSSMLNANLKAWSQQKCSKAKLRCGINYHQLKSWFILTLVQLPYLEVTSSPSPTLPLPHLYALLGAVQSLCRDQNESHIFLKLTISIQRFFS